MLWGCWCERMPAVPCTRHLYTLQLSSALTDIKNAQQQPSHRKRAASHSCTYTSTTTITSFIFGAQEEKWRSTSRHTHICTYTRRTHHRTHTNTAPTTTTHTPPHTLTVHEHRLLRVCIAGAQTLCHISHSAPTQLRHTVLFSISLSACTCVVCGYSPRSSTHTHTPSSSFQETNKQQKNETHSTCSSRALRSNAHSSSTAQMVQEDTADGEETQHTHAASVDTQRDRRTMKRRIQGHWAHSSHRDKQTHATHTYVLATNSATETPHTAHTQLTLPSSAAERDIRSTDSMAE